MGDRGQLFNVHHVQLRIAQRLGVDRTGLGVDGGTQPVKVVGIHKSNRNAQLRQRVVEQVVGSAVERCGGDDLLSCGGQRRRYQRLRRLARGRRQTRHSALQSRHPLFKHVGGGVHDAGIDVAKLLQRKQPRRVVRVMEHIGGGLIDGHGSRSGGRVGDLAGVHGESGKLLLFWFRHDWLLLSLVGRGGECARRRHQKTARILLEDPGRLTSRSVALTHSPFS